MYNAFIEKTRKTCGICGYTDLVIALDLPKLPLTGIFLDKKPGVLIKGINQQLLLCPRCGQGQLLHQVDPSILYDFKRYTFRTSASINAKEGTNLFLRFLKPLVGKKIFDYGIDIGCNDLYLLNESASFIRQRLGIDPIWSRKDPGNLPNGTKVLGKTLEEADLKQDLLSKPDIVFCRHTLEHIFDPAAAIAKLIEFTDNHTLFVFEFPSFETLIERYRFDQVFHEHLQYFSLASFEYILKLNGAKIIAWSQNYHNWGATIVAFRMGKAKEKKFKFTFTPGYIKQKIELFKKQLGNTEALLRDLSDGDIYGYGAAMMLPVLGYHLNTDFSFLKALLDDDINKDGKYYANLPLRISYSGKAKLDVLMRSNVLVTAVDSAKPIIIKLLTNRVKNIIYPFGLI